MRHIREQWEIDLEQEIKQNKILALETTKHWTTDKELQRYIVKHLGAFGLENFDCDWSDWDSVELCVLNHEEELYYLSEEFR